MNREIKFRGKNYENKWKYGDLVQEKWKQGKAIMIKKETTAWSVLEDTVGQYTGLHDKNGKEIYEGDVLKSMRWSYIYLVKHIGTAFYLCRKGNNGFNKITTWNNAEKSEIIGNITDNPELLGGES